MAVIYSGRELRTRRAVFLKTLSIEYRNDPETRVRFRLEARTMAFLKHPNVARVFDLYEDAEAPWAVLEYISGDSLKDLVQERGPFELPEIANVLDQVASALAHLHAKGLIHLDVKPQNILLTDDGIVKLIDFGLAQQAGSPQELIGGSTFGTAAYLTPEQAAGEPVDVSTDVYSLGCVVYELLTGRPPFKPTGGRDVKHEIIRAHLEQEPEPPSKVNPALPPWVDDVVLRALARQPDDRYRDTETFARLFRAAIVGAVAEKEIGDAQAFARGVGNNRQEEMIEHVHDIVRVASVAAMGAALGSGLAVSINLLQGDGTRPILAGMGSLAGISLAILVDFAASRYGHGLSGQDSAVLGKTSESHPWPELGSFDLHVPQQPIWTDRFVADLQAAMTITDPYRRLIAFRRVVIEHAAAERFQREQESFASALQAARAIDLREARVEALLAIAAAQVQAGDFAAALETTREIE